MMPTLLHLPSTLAQVSFLSPSFIFSPILGTIVQKQANSLIFQNPFSISPTPPGTTYFSFLFHKTLPRVVYPHCTSPPFPFSQPPFKELPPPPPLRKAAWVLSTKNVYTVKSDRRSSILI